MAKPRTSGSSRSALSAKAISSLEVCAEPASHLRALKLQRVDEYSFALLILWNRIEALVKLVRYHDRIKEGWPDELHFMRASWSPLKRLKDENPDFYSTVFSGDQCLWKLRNKIAHSNLELTRSTANTLEIAGGWVCSALTSICPSRESLIRKKRNSDAQTKRT